MPHRYLLPSAEVIKTPKLEFNTVSSTATVKQFPTSSSPPLQNHLWVWSEVFFVAYLTAVLALTAARLKFHPLLVTRNKIFRGFKVQLGQFLFIATWLGHKKAVSAYFHVSYSLLTSVVWLKIMYFWSMHLTLSWSCTNKSISPPFDSHCHVIAGAWLTGASISCCTMDAEDAQTGVRSQFGSSSFPGQRGFTSTADCFNCFTMDVGFT